MMALKYDGDKCGCGLVETTRRCYMEKKERWRGDVRYLKDGMDDEYETIKWYDVRSDEVEKETTSYLKVMWNSICRDMLLVAFRDLWKGMG